MNKPQTGDLTSLTSLAKWQESGFKVDEKYSFVYGQTVEFDLSLPHNDSELEYEFEYNKKLGEIKFLEEENKKLKSDLSETQKIGESWRQECKQLREDLEHRDSFFSIMRDVLANEEIDNTQLAAILYCVVHFEC